jgi:phosphoribosylformimino-5-aminoimidazole carboxamide ribotide isomerase
MIPIFPAIDIRGGKCVRLIQGDYDQQLDYADDPVAVAQQFEAAEAEWLHVVDLDGAKEGRPVNLDVIRRIIESTSLKVEVGGGIRNDDTVDAILAAGAARAVIGTRALEDWDWFDALVNAPARAHRIALGLDMRDGRLAIKGWTESTEKRPVDVAEAVNDWPLAAIIYTDISRDGMLLGPNLEAIRDLVGVSKIPIIASGGVTDIDDVRRLSALQLGGIIIGRALYEQQIDLAEAIRVAAA